MDFLSTLAGWLGNPVVGGTVGLIGGLLTIAAFFQRRWDHHSRKRYKSSIIKQLDNIVLVAGLYQRNLHNTLLMGRLHLSLGLIVITFTAIISMGIAILSPILNEVQRGYFMLMVVPPWLLALYQVAKAIESFGRTYRNIIRPHKVLIDIIKSMDSAKASILSPEDRREILERVATTRSILAATRERPLSPPHKDA